LALPGVVAADLFTAAQVFGFRDDSGRYTFNVCAEVAGQVESSTGIRVEAQAGLDQLAIADTVLVPGYFPPVPPASAVLDALRSAHARGARLVAVCTGAFAVAATGLLDGRRATTHWRESAEFRRRFPAVRLDPEVLYVDGTDLLTGAGQSASVDFYLHLVATDFGAVAADEVARRMVVSSRRSSQSSQDVRRLGRESAQSSDPLTATLEWAIEHLHEPVTLRQMAVHSGMPVRTFTRRLRSRTNLAPMQWLAGQRVLEAQRLLEGTDLAVEEVAYRSGHGTAANLRLHMKRELGSTPTVYRQTHRRAHPSEDQSAS
jgi:transcriptional regulator GlxA family with amidase domain